MKSDLLEKKLKILKDLCYVKEGDKERIKEAGSPEIKDYIQTKMDKLDKYSPL